MPPKAKITKEMIVNAAFEITRGEGADKVNARTVAQALCCSTQPVMYHFTKIEDLKRAVYEKTGWFHTEYLMNVISQEDAMLEIGLNYIRFAVEEPNLFRFLFQSGFAAENSLAEMVDAEGAAPVVSAMQEAMRLNLEQTKEVFLTLAMFVHGYASMVVNNALEYDENVVANQLERVCRGAILVAQEERK